MYFFKLKRTTLYLDLLSLAKRCGVPWEKIAEEGLIEETYSKIIHLGSPLEKELITQLLDDAGAKNSVIRGLHAGLRKKESDPLPLSLLDERGVVQIVQDNCSFKFKSFQKRIVKAVQH
jgi:hypothetical protein